MTQPAGDCSHLDQVRDVSPKTPKGCEECLELGMQWVHLRVDELFMEPAAEPSA